MSKKDETGRAHWQAFVEQHEGRMARKEQRSTEPGRNRPRQEGTAVRWDRVLQIRSQILSGIYEVSVLELADAILQQPRQPLQ